MSLRRVFYIVYVLFVIFFYSCGKDNEPASPGSDMPNEIGSGEGNGYVLVWEDLFDNGTLGSWWNVEVNDNGGGNNELQYYTENNITIETDSVSHRKCLVITARKEKYKTRDCTSGRLNTRENIVFTHGKIEALIKLPVTYKGLWPAFWMLGNDFKSVGWPKCGEIDILEMGNRGGLKDQDRASRFMNGALHSAATDAHNSYNTLYDYSVQDGEFHLFTLIWDEQLISMYVDLDKFSDAKPYYIYPKLGENVSDPTSVGYYFHKPFFLIFNLAIGGNYPGIYDINGITALNAENNYTAKMYVDYVRVYQKPE